MSILSLLLVLIVVGVALYLVGLIPMDPTVAIIIRVVAILLVVVWLLDAFIGLGSLGTAHTGRVFR